MSLSRSIGYLLRKPLTGADEETLVGLRSVVVETLALAYCVAIDVEGVGFDRRFQSEVWDICHQRVCAGLCELGLLPSIGRRVKLKATTGTYAEVGLLLRVVQSTELIDQDQGRWRHMTNMWPWGEYAA
jgi:hypothetical protein